MPDLIPISFDSELIAKLASQGWRISGLRCAENGESFISLSYLKKHWQPMFLIIQRWSDPCHSAEVCLILTPIPKPKRYRPPTFGDLDKKCPLECEVRYSENDKWKPAILTGMDLEPLASSCKYFTKDTTAPFCRIEATDE